MTSIYSRAAATDRRERAPPLLFIMLELSCMSHRSFNCGLDIVPCCLDVEVPRSHVDHSVLLVAVLTRLFIFFIKLKKLLYNSIRLL